MIHKKKRQEPVLREELFVNAKPVDFTLTTNDKRLAHFVRELDAARSLTTRGPINETDQYYKILKIVIMNFIKYPWHPYFSISRSKFEYEETPYRYRIHDFSRHMVCKALDFLEHHHLINQIIGSDSTGLITRIAPTLELKQAIASRGLQNIAPRRLVNICEVIVLKDIILNQNQKIGYRDNDLTKRMRADIKSINDHLNNFDVSYNGHRLCTNLYRVFNNGSFSEGGRFYGADHIGIPGKERIQILIDGQSVSEIDYRCIHIHMLYLKATGKLCPFSDAYTIEGFEQHREIFKIVLQIVLNANRRPKALGAIRRSFKNFNKKREQKKNKKLRIRISPEAALNAFEKKHQAISSFFFTGIGIHLQFEDSRIAAEILKVSVKHSIPVLPVHDSFICPSNHENWLIQLMASSSVKVCGTEIPIKIKRSNTEILKYAA